MSIVIIAFDNAPKISEEAQRKETELDSLLETKVKGRIAKRKPLKFKVIGILGYLYNTLSATLWYEAFVLGF